MSVVEFAGNPEEEELEEQSDNEDARARNDYNIEEAIIGFIDEPSICHNCIPEFESENGEEGDSRRRHRRERVNIKRGEGDLFQGQIFFNGIAFKEAVLDYALKTERNIKQYMYDKNKIGYSCATSECEWRIYCSVSGDSEKWQVKVLKNVYSCVPNGECEMLKVHVIARLFIDKIREEPEYFMPMKIEELIMERWKISVSRLQCQAARRNV